MVKKLTPLTIIVRILAVIVALYVLFPFALVVINIFRKAASIVQNPVSVEGMSFSQLQENFSKVINNSNFSFWSAFGTSALVTIASLLLLGLFGGMAAWVIDRKSVV